jgi:hypothetical protein
VIRAIAIPFAAYNNRLYLRCSKHSNAVRITGAMAADIQDRYGRWRQWQSRLRNKRTNMSGENHRVVFGTGETVRYRLFNSEKEARGAAADAIHQGTVSQVAVEENRKGQWVPSLAPGKRG